MYGDKGKRKSDIQLLKWLIILYVGCAILILLNIVWFISETGG